ncbi:MAG: hypothetical protein KGZ97_05240 [Bacteroidetes bacterium]|nr:hypothetical protein [Bacteroidota bacterium]
MKKYIIVILLSFFMINADASVLANDYQPVTAIRASYVSALLSPGGKIGLEYPYKYREIEKYKRDKTIIHYKERYIVISLGSYYQQGFHTNLMLQAEWTFRKQRSRGMYFDYSPVIGLSRTFIDGTTYSVDDSGNVSVVKYAGDYYGILGASISLGYNFGMRSNRPIKMFLKPSLLVLFPYSNMIYPRPTIELGLSYSFKK